MGSMKQGEKVAVIASLGSSLTNFRLDLLKRMVANGHQVLACAPEIGADTRETLSGFGVGLREIPMARTGINPFEDLNTVRALTSVLREFRPDVVLPYTMKPIIYGNMAAKYSAVKRRYALFTGLGYTFSVENPTGKRAAVRAIAIRLYRHALQGLDLAFVYNPAEEADLRRYRLVPPSVPVLRVPGSGVDLSRYEYSNPSVGTVKFLMIARLLKSKGVGVYVEAARLLKRRGVTAEIQLLGPIDPNPDSYKQTEIDRWQQENILSYLGATEDVRPYIRDCSVIVLPTMYREGIPRTVLEGMSMGRAVITTDVPGSAHSIVDGEDGFIVPAGNATALADAMEKLINDPALAASMGRSGRRRAETDFDVHQVNRILLQNMGLEN